jgi:hypothetical protein
MGSGRITIVLGGAKFPLTFGMLAIEEFGQRQSIGPSGWTKLMTDLVYSGYVNEEIAEGRGPALTYREVSELMDDLISSKSDVLAEVFKCFEESKAGSELMGNVKKKLEESQPQEKLPSKKQTGTKSKGSPSGN